LHVAESTTAMRSVRGTPVRPPTTFERMRFSDT
jgi:hypothetical protein